MLSRSCCSTAASSAASSRRGSFAMSAANPTVVQMRSYFSSGNNNTNTNNNNATTTTTTTTTMMGANRFAISSATASAVPSRSASAANSALNSPASCRPAMHPPLSASHHHHHHHHHHHLPHQNGGISTPSWFSLLPSPASVDKKGAVTAATPTANVAIAAAELPPKIHLWSDADETAATTTKNKKPKAVIAAPSAFSSFRSSSVARPAAVEDVAGEEEDLFDCYVAPSAIPSSPTLTAKMGDVVPSLMVSNGIDRLSTAAAQTSVSASNNKKNSNASSFSASASAFSRVVANGYMFNSTAEHRRAVTGGCGGVSRVGGGAVAPSSPSPSASLRVDIGKPLTTAASKKKTTAATSSKESPFLSSPSSPFAPTVDADSEMFSVDLAIEASLAKTRRTQLFPTPTTAATTTATRATAAAAMAEKTSTALLSSPSATKPPTTVVLRARSAPHRHHPHHGSSSSSSRRSASSPSFAKQVAFAAAHEARRAAVKAQQEAEAVRADRASRMAAVEALLAKQQHETELLKKAMPTAARRVSSVV